MAGSYYHLLDEAGDFTTKHLAGMKDSDQALEECFFIIGYLADRVGSNKQKAIDEAVGAYYSWRAEYRGDSNA